MLFFSIAHGTVHHHNRILVKYSHNKTKGIRFPEEILETCILFCLILGTLFVEWEIVSTVSHILTDARSTGHLRMTV